MDDLFYCIRIMQISSDKLQSSCNSESLRRSSLIRSTFLQSRKQFCDLVHSFIKVSSTTTHFLPVVRHTDDRIEFVAYRPAMTSQKRKSCQLESVKRRRIAAPSTSSTSTNVSNSFATDLN